MALRTYSDHDIRAFLRALDSFASGKRTDVIVIGGAAAAIAYHVGSFTKDIDTMNDVTALEDAGTKARKQTGLEIPFGQAGVADGPYHYEDRLLEVPDLKLSHLRVLVPEVHDLILMKVVRAYEPDLQMIEKIVQSNQVDSSILVDRFRNEMSHVVGRRENLELNFLAAIERSFGVDVASRLHLTGMM